MFIIMGGTGHVGSATASELLRQGHEVAIVSRQAAGADADAWRAKGARVIEADVADVASLRAAFRRGRRALLLNPPADTHEDTDAVERRTVGRILEALDGSGLEKVVAVSTAGAQAGARLGDLNVLWELEQGLRQQAIPAAINRGAYYMSNWDGLVDQVRRDRVLPSMIPATMKIPMVAPQDLGLAAAQRLLSPVEDVGVRTIEGPDRYSPADVARAFSQALGLSVDVRETTPGKLKEAFLALGFSDAAADSYARMTELSIRLKFDPKDDAWRGATSLDSYIKALVSGDPKAAATPDSIPS
jgi:uncharacterized protein YbjT (DUF2867 family)